MARSMTTYRESTKYVRLPGEAASNHGGTTLGLEWFVRAGMAYLIVSITLHTYTPYLQIGPDHSLGRLRVPISR